MGVMVGRNLHAAELKHNHPGSRETCRSFEGNYGQIYFLER